MKAKRKAVIDDGMCPELVRDATFDGTMGIPMIRKEEGIPLPKRMVPFSRRRQSEPGDAIVFYENDVLFSEVLISPERFIADFEGRILVAPDCSQYRNAPLAVQIANLYRSRAIGCYYQGKGIHVIPTVRWGNALTFTKNYLPERIAFLGVERNATVAISCHGCVRSAEDRIHFREGLRAMVDELNPKTVLVYGPMPKDVFSVIPEETGVIRYPDWISLCRGGEKNG